MLNKYRSFFLEGELKNNEVYQRDVLNFIPRNKWMDHLVLHKCKCQNEGQDALYGNGVRVMNRTSKEGQYRCTSCAAEMNDGTTKKK